MEHVAEQFAQGGSLSPQLRSAFEKFLEAQLKDDRLRRYMEERVNVVLYRGAEARAEIDEEAEEYPEYLDPNDAGDMSDNDARA